MHTPRKGLSPGTVLAGTLILSAIPLGAVELFPALKVVFAPATYLLFHNIAEFFSILVSLSMFSIGWYTYEQSKDRHALFLSAAFLAIGLLDFMHVLANVAMPPLITLNSSNKSIQFWLVARLFQAIAFLVSAFVYQEKPGRWLSKRVLMTVALLVPAFVFIGITFFPSYLPVTYATGIGVTPFKHITEYLIVGVLGAATVAYWRRIVRSGDSKLLYYVVAFSVCIFGEMPFAIYTRLQDTYSVLGHLYKVAAFALMYYGIYRASVKAPYLKLVELTEDLDSKVAQRTAELASINAQLSQSEQRYRELLTYAPTAIYEIDFRSQRIVTVNDATCRMSGYTRDELLSMNPLDLLDDEGRAAFKQRIARWLAGEAPDDTVEYRLLAKDGHTIDSVLNVSFTVDDEGKPLGATVVGHDITARKQAEEALLNAKTHIEDEKHRLEALMTALPVGVALFDAQGGDIGHNEAYVAIWGGNLPLTQGLDAYPLYRAWWPDSGRPVQPEEWGSARASLFGETVFGQIIEIEGFDGVRRIIHNSAVPIRDDDGQVAGGVVAIQDITALRHVEEALRESEARYRTLVYASPDAVFLYRNHAIILANPAALQLFGFDNNFEFFKLPVIDLFHSDSKQAVSQRIVRLLSEQIKSTSEDIIVRTNGEIRDVETTAVALQYRGSHAIQFNMRDITERKRVEDALRESEAKFRLLADMTPVAIAIVQDGLVKYANPYMMQSGGYQEEDLLGQPFLRFIQPAYHAMIRDRYQRRMQGEHMPDRYEIEGVSKDGGHSGWYDFQASVIEYQGRPAILATAHDITERKQMEEALREADRAKDEFLAVLSHELQTPLTSMLGWSAEALRNGTPEMMAQAMTVIQRNAIRQKRLVDDLLDISKLIHNKIELQRELIGLEEQAQQAVDSVQQLAEKQQLHLIYEPSPDPLPIHADPARIQQCISNLLNNSLKFTPAGGTITVRCHSENERAYLTVEDTGRGIPPGELSTLFQVFRQVDRSERYGGLGLGLAVTRGIIELHGGSIHAESEGPGRGSRFTISLPIANESSAGGGGDFEDSEGIDSCHPPSE